MDNKIWFYVVFAALSLLYKAYKKNKNASKSLPSNSSKEEIHSAESSGWGMDDLISQFEQKYGVEEVQKPSVSENQYSEQHYEDYHQKEDDVEEISESKISENTYEEVSESLYNKMEVNLVEEEQSKTVNLDLDLRQMVIHSTILNRPEH